MAEISLIDRILCRQNMDLAWERIYSKKGAPGIDEVTLDRWARNWEINIERLREQVKTNTYHPNPPKRIKVLKMKAGYSSQPNYTGKERFLREKPLNSPVCPLRIL